jgi:hypothetical protein
MKKLGSALVVLVAMLGGAGEVWAKTIKAILRRGLFALAIMLAPAVPAFAGPYEDGRAAYQRGDYLCPSLAWHTPEPPRPTGIDKV